MLIDIANSDLRPAHVPAQRYEDPLDEDEEADVVVRTTRRGLVRLALVAAETASRFAREDVATDPMAWLLSPRRLFDGEAAIDACLGLDGCMKAIVLHGLGMGMDADPERIEELYDEDDGRIDGCADDAAVRVEDSERRPRLWTSFLVEGNDADVLHAFDAVVAADRREAEARLRARHGAAAFGAAVLHEGFDAGLPLVEALVSPAMADMLEQVALDPSSPLAEGLSVSIRQRFAA